MKMRECCPVILAAALILCGGLARAEEAGGAEEAGAKRPREADRGGDRARAREIMRKMRAGEQLTDDEKALVEKFRARLGPAGVEGAGPAGQRPELPRPAGAELPGLEGLDLVNAVDAVRLALAATHLSKDKADEAVKVLEALLVETKDETAKGFAHLLMARCLRQKGENEKADAELKKVTGPAAVQALLDILGQGEPSAERLEELLKGAQDVLVKAVLIRRLTGLYARAGDAGKLADLAERATKLLKPEEALAAVEVEARLRAGRGAAAPVWAQPGGVERMFRQRRDQMEARAKELEGEGKKDEAARIREQLERMDRLGDWLRGGGGGRRNQGAAEVERLQKEIKELEDAGMKKEAEAKRKELEALKARAGRRQREPEPVPADDGEQF